MKILFLYILSLSLSGSILGQVNLDPKNLIGKDVVRELGEILTSYESGSGISLVYFPKNSDKKQKIIVFSSNSNSKLILDSFFLKISKNRIAIKNTSYNFILPIIQIMYDDEKNKISNTLSWNHNSFEQMSEFKSLNKISNTVFFINPLIIYGSPPIKN